MSTAPRPDATAADAYAWLRDPNWQAVMRDPAVLQADIRAFLDAENARVDAALADTADLQEALFEELKARIKEDDSSVPARDGAFYYYRRFEAGRDYALHCRTRGLDGPEEILLDENALAEGRAFCRVIAVEHSPDHRLFAYAVDFTGGEFYELHVIETATGKLLTDVIEHASGSFAWDAAGEVLFWTELDDNHRPCRVWAHRLGMEENRLVYEETDPGFFLGVGRTDSGRFVVIDAHDHETSEVRLIPADRPDASPVLVAPRVAGHRYAVEHHGDRLLILTNADGAEDFKIAEAPVDRPQQAHWGDLVPHEEGRLIQRHMVFANHLVRLEMVDALPRAVVRDLRDGREHVIAFDEDAYDLMLVPSLEFGTDELRFAYSSMTTPLSVFDYDMDARTRVRRKVQEIPSGHDSAAYVTRRIHARAPDGEEVPVSLLYRKDTPLDGTAPCLLYGYGSYGNSMEAAFNANRLSLVDRGFVYAIAHIRGGKEKGYRWYREGKLLNKKNTFTDFIAAGEALAEQGITARGRIVAHGGSAGGMLMGAVANMAPDLFLGIVADVPFVDVLNTMSDPSLPLTPPEWPEWGNPIEDAAARAYIASYSPYENVTAQDYPHILATAGLTDPRVTYWEPAKWVARLRERRTGDRLLLLRTNMEAGHAGKSGRFEYLREVALKYAFVLKVAGKA
ncbi:S9 family peptidase [Futiania mangrovi]|uniref:S9 family peptidase n=1 Tax=Futiania mangrovi TaxID=2959716 RepID=A0A9J6PLK3_9PROT|nr:S9 family peptidase [Futiania mangrovii]MCP1337519.1 S9 family peptidase [Futiania mangrovii]